MRGALLKAVAAAAAVGLAASAQAQKPQFIEAGKIVAGKAGKAGQADLYQFIGVMGTEVTISLKASGQAAVTLFTPTGEEMLTERGTGEVTLRAVLPLANAYTLAVSRSDLTKPYSLKLAATDPDLHQMFFAKGVGYNIRMKAEGGTPPFYSIKTCWLDPGRKLRRIWPKGIEELSLGRDGMEYATMTLNGKEPRFLERRVRFEDGAAIYTTYISGTTDTRETKVTLEAGSLAGLGPFHSYRCQQG